MVTIVLLLTAMRSKNERVHSLIFVTAAALMIAFIAVFQFRLG